ncbi:hypothetical protein AA103581_1964 [Gluconobacter wancherniae NBRC 103581]|nr:hypothetical protein AA103581_1964 [Gluconobacter wancherniae NBRC 103581]
MRTHSLLEEGQEKIAYFRFEHLMSQNGAGGVNAKGKNNPDSEMYLREFRLIKYDETACHDELIEPLWGIVRNK